MFSNIWTAIFTKTLISHNVLLKILMFESDLRKSYLIGFLQSDNTITIKSW